MASIYLREEIGLIYLLIFYEILILNKDDYEIFLDKFFIKSLGSFNCFCWVLYSF